MRERDAVSPPRRAVRFLGCAVVAAAMTAAASSVAVAGRQGAPLEAVGEHGPPIGLQLPAGPGAPGEIERVVVVEDHASRIRLQIQHTNLGGHRIGGAVYSESGGRTSEVPCELVSVPPRSMEVTFDCAVHPRVSVNTRLATAYLQLIVHGQGGPIQTRTFRLAKSWEATAATAAAADGLAPPSTVRITPQPIGTAASLTEVRPGTPPKPGRVIRPVAVSVPAIASVRTPSTSAAAVKKGGQAAKPVSLKQVRRAIEAERARQKNKARIEKFRGRFAGLADVPDDAKALGAEGPDNLPIEFLESGLHVEDGVGLMAPDILALHPIVFPDRNRKSGVFYYLPHAYHLVWHADGGYQMSISYGAAVADDQSGEVVMDARVSAGLDLADIEVARALVAAYAKRHAKQGWTFAALQRMPVETTDVTLAAGLHAYAIPPEKIAVTGMADMLGEIDITWSTDPVTKENMQLALVGKLGVSGSVVFTPSGERVPAVSVPLRLQTGHPRVFGRLAWSRDGRWQNRTPYPLRFNYLHALVLGPDQTPIVYSWDLGGTTVAPGSAVQWEASRVPRWLDGDAKRLWVDYAVADDCEPCAQQAMQSVTGGVSSLGTESLVVHTISPMADLGAYEVAFHLRSKYLDPSKREMQYRTAVLKADNTDVPLGTIYLVDRQAGESVPGDPLFEYRLDVTMPDGRQHVGTTWIASDTVRVLVGRAQVEQSLGFLPEPPEGAGGPGR